MANTEPLIKKKNIEIPDEFKREQDLATVFL
jgi:hypothetical protein